MLRNGTKLARPEYDNILNCTIKEDDVENKLKYIFNVDEYIEEVIIKALDNSVRTNNTKELLLAVYNGKTSHQKHDANILKTKLRDEIKIFYDSIINYQITDDKDEKEYFFENEFSRRSNFIFRQTFRMDIIRFSR